MLRHECVIPATFCCQNLRQFRKVGLNSLGAKHSNAWSAPLQQAFLSFFLQRRETFCSPSRN
ncbi:hypothetical protein Mapa_006030 [Marchantia paleacea]|nr:hypothetical protein Mapa_006030 [Marchantia paleacea]